MMKKFLMLVLACLLISTQTGTTVFAADQSTTDTQTLEQVKVNVNRAGVGEKARVTVRLKDGTKRKGYVAERHDEDFVLRDRKTDAPSTIAYRDVSKIGIDHGHSTARNTTIGVAIGVGAVVIVLGILVASEFDD
jgi:preprotein translocase subunit SecF